MTGSAGTAMDVVLKGRSPICIYREEVQEEGGLGVDGKRSDALDVSGSKTALPVETMSSSDSLLVVPNTTFACLLLILFLLFCTLERSGSVFALSWTPFGILKGSCGGTWAFF